MDKGEIWMDIKSFQSVLNQSNDSVEISKLISNMP